MPPEWFKWSTFRSRRNYSPFPSCKCVQTIVNRENKKARKVILPPSGYNSLLTICLSNVNFCSLNWEINSVQGLKYRVLFRTCTMLRSSFISWSPQEQVVEISSFLRFLLFSESPQSNKLSCRWVTESNPEVHLFT